LLPGWQCGRLGVAFGLRRARVPLPGQAGGHHDDAAGALAPYLIDLLLCGQHSRPAR
jgi:hypothetical protein